VVSDEQESFVKASAVYLEAIYGSIYAALIRTDPVMEMHDGFCVINATVGKE